MANILIVGGGPEITLFKDSIIGLNEHNFYSISEIPPLHKDIMVSSLVVDFSQWGHTVNSLKNINASFDSIICLDDILTHIADELSRELGTLPISNLSFQPFKYKDRMRMVCESLGIKTPKYKIIHNYSDTHKVSQWSFPLIVKPTCFLSSIGVKKVDNFQELQSHANRQLHVKFPLYFDKVYELGEIYGLENRVLVEEYIEGDEYSIESIIVDGVYIPIGVTKKITHENDFMDEVGHIFPAKIDKDLEEKIYHWSSELHKALQLQNTATHAEFRINKHNEIVLMEIGARIGGDYISKLVEYNSESGFNFFEAHLSARLGYSTKNIKGNSFYGIAHIKVPSEFYGETFSELIFPDFLSMSSEIIEKTVIRDEGFKLPNPIDWSNERLGYVILKNDSYELLKEDLNFILNNIKVEIQ